MRKRKIFDVKKENLDLLEKNGLNSSEGINQIISFFFNNSIKNQRDINLNKDVSKILEICVHNALAIEFILKEGFEVDPEEIYGSGNDENKTL